MRESKARFGWVLVAGLLAGCSGLPRLSWPWGKPPPVAPAPVDELTFAAGAGTAIPQYWSGNTLVLDLTAAPASGAAVATPTYARGWPMRMAVRTWPGRFGALEVRGAQRVLLPLTTEGSAVVEIPIPPGVYPPGTREVSLGWGAPAMPAVVFPQAPDTPAPPQSSMP
ncbi:MAG: hypothetical protein AB7V24_15140 [Steroidobacteraceae bacterium]